MDTFVIGCFPGDIRLQDGTQLAGRVEVWHHGPFGSLIFWITSWQSVCDDSWDINDANVVCRQLGYRGAVAAHSSAYFGRGTGNILLDQVDCTGLETALIDCPHNGLHSHDCTHYEDAGVTCESINQ